MQYGRICYFSTIVHLWEVIFLYVTLDPCFFVQQKKFLK